jgi:DNA-binding response OmpR family regulator
MPKILIAEDHSGTRRVLEALVRQWGHDPVTAEDGTEAWNRFQNADAPCLALLDWLLPRVSGLDLVQMIRENPRKPRPYLILLTSRNRKEDLVAGLNAGADDYIVKPWNANELWARVNAGLRLIGFQNQLEERVAELEAARSKIEVLQGLLPICAHCRRIRDGENQWHRLEHYIETHTPASFTHGVCPECRRLHYPRRSNQSEPASAGILTVENPGSPS